MQEDKNSLLKMQAALLPYSVAVHAVRRKGRCHEAFLPG